MIRNFLLASFLFFCSPLLAFNNTIFYQKLNEPIPQWTIEQIEEDLAPFTKELSREFIDDLFIRDDGLCLVRVQVIDGHLYIQKSPHSGTELHTTPNQIIPHLHALHKLVKLPNIDFLFSAHDGKESSLPFFCITKYNNSSGVIVMPDMFALNGFEPSKTEVMLGNQIFPWESKSNVVFYRGSDFANFETKDRSKWLNHPRPKLVALSLKYPNLIDAKFTGLYAPWHARFAKSQGFMGDYVSMKKHPFYKYLISVDAGCAATPRLPLLLHSNSVVFKNSTSSILWFFKALRPYKHYIPVAEDLSDLFSQLDWAKTHDEECKTISENAQKLAAECLTHEAVYVYLYRLLVAYSNKQNKFYQ